MHVPEVIGERFSIGRSNKWHNKPFDPFLSECSNFLHRNAKIGTSDLVKVWAFSDLKARSTRRLARSYAEMWRGKCLLWCDSWASRGKKEAFRELDMKVSIFVETFFVSKHVFQRRERMFINYPFNYPPVILDKHDQLAFNSIQA